MSFANEKCLLLHLVAKRDHAVIVSLHLRKVQRDVLVEPLEEWDSITDEDGHDRITNLVGKPKAKAFTGNCATSNEPNTREGWLQSIINQPRKVSRVKLNAIPGPWEFASGEDEGWLFAVGPAEPLGFKLQGRFVGSRSHHVAVDSLQERCNELRGPVSYTHLRAHET